MSRTPLRPLTVAGAAAAAVGRTALAHVPVSSPGADRRRGTAGRRRAALLAVLAAVAVTGTACGAPDTPEAVAATATSAPTVTATVIPSGATEDGGTGVGTVALLAVPIAATAAGAAVLARRRRPAGLRR